LRDSESGICPCDAQLFFETHIFRTARRKEQLCVAKNNLRVSKRFEEFLYFNEILVFLLLFLNHNLFSLHKKNKYSIRRNKDINKRINQQAIILFMIIIALSLGPNVLYLGWERKA